MAVAEIRDLSQIERFLRPRAGANVYLLGDLDEPYAQNARWLGHYHRGSLEAVALVYSLAEGTLVIAADPGKEPALMSLLSEATALLPDAFSAQLGPGVEASLGTGFAVEPRWREYRMTLTRNVGLPARPWIERLALADAAEIVQLYDAVYAGATHDPHYFDPALLESGHWFGARESGRLLAVAGTHVFSPKTSVAAIAGVATHPAHRLRGLASAAMAAVMDSVRAAGIQTIGLNVLTTNRGAIDAYRKLGFEIVTDFGAFAVQRRAP